ncbi:RNA polymerase sigma factor [Sinomicrobium oceani]|uniref:RNA polymerase sigma factor n=1 Tax=Sinomicrobium oceani TaxID=1150368 RepID=UPI00227C57AE|nr:RNA polymerase sigma factor [Sinomicrobium oceani]
MMNKDDFEALYASHYHKVFRLCLGYTGGHEALTQDLTQEVFLKVWTHRNTLRDVSVLPTWLYRITVNTCLQELRKKKFLSLRTDVVEEEGSKPDERERRLQAMYRCIDRLPVPHKSIILLDLEGISQAEIAEITGISHGALRTRLHRIKDQLSKCVKND